MTEQESLQRSIENNPKRSKDDWEIFLMTSIANSLAIIADCMTEKERKEEVHEQ